MTGALSASAGVRAEKTLCEVKSCFKIASARAFSSFLKAQEEEFSRSSRAFGLNQFNYKKKK